MHINICHSAQVGGPIDPQHPSKVGRVTLAAKAEPGARDTDFFQDATIDDLRLAAIFRRGFRQAMIQINRSLAQHDLSPIQYHLLLEAGAAGCEGLVRTLRCAPDRRMVRVGLTETGCRVVEAALHAQRAALHEMAQDFNAPGVAQMLRGAVQLYLGVDIAEEGRL